MAAVRSCPRCKGQTSKRHCPPANKQCDWWICPPCKIAFIAKGYFVRWSPDGRS